MTHPSLGITRVWDLGVDRIRPRPQDYRMMKRRKFQEASSASEWSEVEL
jgi:hypothetical protein